VEVKSTSGIGQSIPITNIRQLDGTGVEALFLLHILLDSRQGGIQSLPELVEEIRRTLRSNSEIAASAFDERLIDAGYLDLHRDRYGRTKYTLRSHRFFRVTSGFPRILETDLATGVGDVRYSIESASCQPFATEDAIVIRCLHGGK
jgi:Putative  PD-(D/E)XK family member, (DUF4420)